MAETLLQGTVDNIYCRFVCKMCELSWRQVP